MTGLNRHFTDTSAVAQDSSPPDPYIVGMEAVMRLRMPAVAIVAALLAAPVQAAGQEPVKSFDQLNTRLKVGDTVWVTDAQGREIKGEIQSLAPDALTLEVDGARTFIAHDVRVIHERTPDSLKNGALIGGSFFGGVALFGCLDTSGGEDAAACAGAAVFNGVLGAAIGAGIDAAIKGPRLVVYRAPGALGATGHARLSVASVITPRTKGVALSISF
jgi:hypothetical protein